jgi:hypothetical protein
VSVCWQPLTEKFLPRGNLSKIVCIGIAFIVTVLFSDSKPTGFSAGDGSDILVFDNAIRYGKRNPLEFLDGFIAQITPGIVNNIMTGGQQGLIPGILTKDDQKRRLLDYLDVLDHDTGTLREVFGPLQAP